MPDSPVGRLRAMYDAMRQAAPGISHDEYRAFLYVAEAEGACQREVQDALELPQSSTSRLLNNLNGARFGLIQADPDPKSRRRQNLRLSPKGRRLIAQLAVILGCFVAAHASILDDIDRNGMPSTTTYDRCADPTVFSCDLS